jgi:hypothetical protein
MMQAFIDLFVGFLAGGFTISAVWGSFWTVIGLVGLSRKTCGWRIPLNGLTVGLVPLLLLMGLVWWSGGTEHKPIWLGAGLVGMPTLLVVLSLRMMPDGKLAGAHLLTSIQALMADILGTHQGCGGCDHEHGHENHR